jgi:hypothetical protein
VVIIECGTLVRAFSGWLQPTGAAKRAREQQAHPILCRRWGWAHLRPAMTLASQNSIAATVATTVPVPPSTPSLKKRLMARQSFLSCVLEWLCFWPLVITAILASKQEKPIDIGIGPEPLVNNPYHKQALEKYGYTVETFVMGTYFITQDFDVNLAKKRIDVLPAAWRPLALMFRALWRYKAVMIYFNGGPLFYSNTLAWLEPWLFKTAGTKVLVLPYGVDVQDMIYTDNLYFRHALDEDYPNHFRQFPAVRQRIHRWTQQADWVFAGVEWVDYLHTWNTLMLGHFSIDPTKWEAIEKVAIPDEFNSESPLRVFHAPNHKAIKGSSHLIKAIEKLQAEGLPIELVIRQKVPNEVIRETMATCHLVADQFVLGWYAMFALEAMAMGRPVLCYLRPDLLKLYEEAGLIEHDEIPLMNTGLLEIEAQLRWAVANPTTLQTLATRGPVFIKKHHATQAVGAVFSDVLQQLGILPSQQTMAL